MAARISGVPCGPVFPYIFPLQLQHGLDKTLHAGRAGLLHGLREMAVAVQHKSGSGMAQVPLNRLHRPQPEGRSRRTYARMLY